MEQEITHQPMESSKEENVINAADTMDTRKPNKLIFISVVVILLILALVIGSYILTAKRTKTISQSPDIARKIPTVSPTSSPLPSISPAINNGASLKVAINLGNDHIIVVNADGSGLKDLGQQNTYGSWAVLSPNNQSVAFVNSKNQVVVADTAVFKQTILASYDPSWQILNLTWSPDGKTLGYSVYANNSSSNNAVVLINPDGTNKRILNLGDQFAWSPDGQQVAVFYNTDTSGGEGSPDISNVSIYNDDGVKQSSYSLSGPITFGYDVYWGEDNKFYFTHQGNGILIYALWSSALDGSNQKLVSGMPDNQPVPSPVQSPVEGAQNVLISPDGRTVLIRRSFPDKDSLFWTMSFDGTDAKPIMGLSHITDGGGVWWLSDSKHFVFNTSDGKHDNYYVSDINGVQPLKIYSYP